MPGCSSTGCRPIVLLEDHAPVPDDRHRTRSATVALTAALAMTVAEGVESGLILLVGSSLALALIWFAEPLAAFTGHIGFRHIARRSPPGLVRAFGWLFLMVFVLAAVVRLAVWIGGRPAA